MTGHDHERCLRDACEHAGPHTEQHTYQRECAWCGERPCARVWEQCDEQPMGCCEKPARVCLDRPCSQRMAGEVR